VKINAGERTGYLKNTRRAIQHRLSFRSIIAWLDGQPRNQLFG
jgi:hypothetical protein